MKYTITLIFFLLSTTLFGQENYLEYYRTIALAEKAVVNGEYDAALKQYQKAFDIYPYNNPIDCYVAAQVASYVGDTTSCIRYISTGLSFGLPIQTINSNPHLTTISKGIYLHTIDSCLNIYQKGINHDARAKMLSLIKYDQSIIHNLPRGESLYNTDGYTLKDSYRPIWDSLVQEVVTLTHKSGFPAQKIIGTQNGEDSLFRIGPNAVFAMYIFIHHSNAWSKVAEMLWIELLKGNIAPQMYGVVYESSSGKGPYETSIIYLASRPCQNKQCMNIISNHLPEIDSNRSKIGLCSYEVMEKKFHSKAQYYKWHRKGAKTHDPFFDFECDLNFQGK